MNTSIKRLPSRSLETTRKESKPPVSKSGCRPSQNMRINKAMRDTLRRILPRNELAVTEIMAALDEPI